MKASDATLTIGDEGLRALARRKLREVDALIARARTTREWLSAAAGCDCPATDVCALSDA